MNKSTSDNQSSRSNDDLIKSVTIGIKDPEKAEAITEIMLAALNGNKELAGIMSRMIKAELDDSRASAT